MRVNWILELAAALTLVGSCLLVYSTVHTLRDPPPDECPAVVPPGTGAWLCMPADESGLRRWRKVEE